MASTATQPCAVVPESESERKRSHLERGKMLPSGASGKETFVVVCITYSHLNAAGSTPQSSGCLCVG